MARHKFASNVCEKALVTADSESRRALINEIMAPNQEGVTPILMMMKSRFSSLFFIFNSYFALSQCESCTRLRATESIIRCRG
jgi:hypothetical protein